MSICPDPEICSLYVDGELSKDEKMNFERHVQLCSKCRHNLDFYQQIKKYISCDNIPEIDLNLSFKKLMLKQSLRNSFLLYNVFYYWKKGRMFLKSSILTFFFTLIVVSIISIRNNSNIKNSNPTFKPIIPIACESHLPVNLKELHFSNMNTFYRYENKMNARACKNMVKTFNGFSNLYSNLETNNKHTSCITVSSMNKEGISNYHMNMPFYKSLNKNEK